MSNEVILLQRPYISFSSPLLLILRQEITAAAVALFVPVVVQRYLKRKPCVLFNYFNYET